MRDGRYTILGKRWKLRYTHFPNASPNLDDGAADCDPPSKPNKEIRIDRRLMDEQKKLLETLLHEALHAADWPKDCDEWVSPAARDIAHLLWSQGCRFLAK